MITASDISERVKRVREQLGDAGVDPSRVRIVAVTKTFSAEVVRAVGEAGIFDIGENYAQDCVAKHAELGDLASSFHWHFIGHVQRNKVKQLAPVVSLWHTVDSHRLASEIAERAPQASVLIEVNLSDDPRRAGCEPSELDDLVGSARELGLDVRGLMCVADPHSDRTPREQFAWVRQRGESLRLSEYSMGMSGDYLDAAQEGATIIRLGQALLGQRGARH